MKNVVVLFLIFSFFLILSPLSLSKQPEYKAYFNLASDQSYYKYVAYKPSQMFGHRVLLSIVDKRPEQEKVFNDDVQFFYDDIWTEPLTTMLGKIFLKELRLSNMFSSVDMYEKRPSLILEIELTSFVGHYDPKTQVSKGVVKIHPVFKSASDNRIIINKIYEAISRSEIRRGNIYTYIITHIGNALHTVMEDMIMDLERAVHSESRK